MKFIDNPLASRTMKAKDVVKVATYYDKYEFAEGTKLCDHVLEEYFKGVAADIDTSGRKIPVAPDVEVFVDALVIANHANLEKSFEAGMTLAWQLLRARTVPIGRTAFSVEHMRKLAPLMNETTDDARSRLPVVLGPVGESYDLQSSGFPEKFVGECSEYFAYQAFISFISSIELSGHNRNNSSCYHFSPERDDNRYVEHSFFLVASIGSSRQIKIRFDGELQNMSIRRRSKEEGWAIIFQTEPADESVVETVAYRVPLSGNLALPPSKGWVSAHPLANGDLDLAYILHDERTRVPG